MIKIVAKSIVKDENKVEYINLAKELVEKSRQEEGCISYCLFQDIREDSIFTVIEEWESKEAIDLHSNSEHFKRIVPLLAELRVGKGEINLYREVQI